MKSTPALSLCLTLLMTLLAGAAVACGPSPTEAPSSSTSPEAQGTESGAPGAQLGVVQTPAEGEPGSESTDAAGGDSGDESEDTGEAASQNDADMAPLSQIYTNPDQAYSIDLPAGWIVDDAAEVVIIRSEDDSASPGVDGVPATMTKIDIVPLPGFPLDLEARVEQIRAELDTIVEEERITLIGGEQAVWLRGSGGMTEDTGIVVTILGDELYQLQAYGNPEPLRAIAYTFRSSE